MLVELMIRLQSATGLRLVDRSLRRATASPEATAPSGMRLTWPLDTRYRFRVEWRPDAAWSRRRADPRDARKQSTV